MSGQSSRSYSHLSLSIVAAALVVGAAIFAASYLGTATTVTRTTTVTVATAHNTNTSSSSSVSCLQTGIHGTLYVRVVTDKTSQAVSGANVTATVTDYCTPGHRTALGLTNSTGYSSGVGWSGNFIVSVVYAGTNYTFPAQTSGAVSLVTLSIPSGVAVERTIACYGLGCGNSTTAVTATTASTSTGAPLGGVQVVSVNLVAPYTPAGPTIQITLRDDEGCCVTSLAAILELNGNYTFSFRGVNSSYPLDQGQTASDTETLVGAGFSSGANYPLIIKGTTQDTVFTDVLQVQIPQGSTSLIYLSASGICTGPGGYAPCWGGSAYVFNCVSAAATSQGCTKQVTSTLSPYPSYVISIRYPFSNQTEPSWANCLWAVQGITPGQGYADCIPINSTSFIMGEQAPPHL